MKKNEKPPFLSFIFLVSPHVVFVPLFIFVLFVQPSVYVSGKLNFSEFQPSTANEISKGLEIKC